MSLMNSLNRLQRAGDATSVANEKLNNAAREIAEEVLKSISSCLQEEEREVNGGWCREYISGHYYALWRGIESSPVLALSSADGADGWKHPIVGRDLEASMQFAKDVSAGLLEEIGKLARSRYAEVCQAEKALQTKRQ